MKPKEKFPIAVLVSGGGTNLQAIIDSIEAGKLHAKIKVVISNIKDAYALKRCEKHGIFSVVHDHKAYPSKEAFETAIAQTIIESGAKLICLAGFMRILSPQFIKKFNGQILNIHPALLPSFPGLHVQKQAIDYGVRISGCTVHFVNEETDAGPIILQASVPVMADDTEDTLAARILKEEHKIYSKAIQLFIEGRLKIEGRRVLIAD